jgi:YHS domain-containing protein
MGAQRSSLAPPQVQAGLSVGTTAATTAAAPPLALDGYCPVTLVEQQRWQVGDRRWGAIHRGRTYLFTGPEQQRKFLANPDRYSPAVSGQDVVMALDYGQEVEGKRAMGVEYQNRVYLFSSDASRQAFSQNPKRYAAEVLQAENPTQTILR